MKIKKLVLDSNIINRCNDLGLTKSFFDELDFEIWIPTYVRNEVLDSKKNDLIKKLKELTKGEIGFFGFADNKNALGFGAGSFYCPKYDDFIKQTVEKHHNDRFIILLTKIHKAYFITNDKKAFNDAEKYKVNSLYFEIYWTKEQFRKALLQQIFV